MRQSYLFMFKRLKTTFSAFFYRKHFYQQHQAEIWFKYEAWSHVSKGVKWKIKIKNKRLAE